MQLTPAQALLLLINHYDNDAPKQSELKKYYLSGAQLHDAQQYSSFCSYLLDDPLLAPYQLLLDENSINNDPTRRYFETHLAYETIKQQISQVKYDDVIDLAKLITALIDPDISEHKLKTIQQVLFGECYKPSFKQTVNLEMSSLMARIKEASIFEELSVENREKIQCLVSVVYLSIVNTWRKTELPIDIYLTHPYYVNKGKILCGREQQTTRTKSFGLLKSHMPLSEDDKAVSRKIYTHWKASDYAKFDPCAPVVQSCFQHFVHPFSNSISGVFLAQLRVLARLKRDGTQHAFMQPTAFIRLIQLTLSIFLYYSGGHSLYEYCCVLSLPEVRDEFRWMPEFDDLNLLSIFYTHNIEAFDTALAATQNYHSMLLNKKWLHQNLYDFHSNQTFFKPTESNIRHSPHSVAELHLR